MWQHKHIQNTPQKTWYMYINRPDLWRWDVQPRTYQMVKRYIGEIYLETEDSDEVGRLLTLGGGSLEARMYDPRLPIYIDPEERR